jgi:hypothetical protein
VESGFIPQGVQQVLELVGKQKPLRDADKAGVGGCSRDSLPPQAWHFSLSYFMPKLFLVHVGSASCKGNLWRRRFAQQEMSCQF